MDDQSSEQLEKIQELIKLNHQAIEFNAENNIGELSLTALRQIRYTLLIIRDQQIMIDSILETRRK